MVEKFNVVLFDGFQTLDAFGPVAVVGQLAEIYRLNYFSLRGGIVKSSHDVQVVTKSFSEMGMSDVLLIPGGGGTRHLVSDEDFLQELAKVAKKAKYLLVVCTGAALLAKTGLLDGRKATTNKKSFEWVCAQNDQVNWQKKARWVVDGNIYTSSGVSAGIDMLLGFVADMYGKSRAVEIARHIEYIWHDEKENDPFAVI